MLGIKEHLAKIASGATDLALLEEFANYRINGFTVHDIHSVKKTDMSLRQVHSVVTRVDDVIHGVALKDLATSEVRGWLMRSAMLETDLMSMYFESKATLEKLNAGVYEVDGIRLPLVTVKDLVALAQAANKFGKERAAVLVQIGLNIKTDNVTNNDEPTSVDSGVTNPFSVTLDSVRTKN
jgi:hypothetical protein